MLSGLINNDKALWIPVAACLAVLSFIIGGALLIHEVADVPFPFLTRDPAATFAAPPYLGLLSNATVLIWTAAATVCLFCAALTGAEQPIHKFLLFSGLLTTILLLDDLYMIHEVVAPAYLGLPEKGVYLIYAMVATSWLVKFRDVIVTTEFGLLILSFFSSDYLSASTYWIRVAGFRLQTRISSKTAPKLPELFSGLPISSEPRSLLSMKNHGARNAPGSAKSSHFSWY